MSPQAAHAQGYFQYFFGRAAAVRSPVRAPIRMQARTTPIAPYGSAPYRPSRAPIARCACALCDGYYFPISFSTMRSEFATRRRQVHGELRQPGSPVLPSQSRRRGRGHGRLDGHGLRGFADRFQVSQNAGERLSCRPQPWSEAELARHRSYQRGQQPGRTPEYGNTAAASAGKLPTADEGADRPPAESLVVERPRPISRYVLPSPPQRNGNLFGAPFSPKRGSPAGLFR